ncbi:UNVERIFIED_CONTAM: hypothetical protein Sangu_3053500 [Sesamum angustifolium]|uniref:Uncharacterized protein n=1 Tax=Sesamum angustifolium TaxID=2727405 RepID=A0AAW2KF04_9LAMI
MSLFLPILPSKQTGSANRILLLIRASKGVPPEFQHSRALGSISTRSSHFDRDFLKSLAKKEPATNLTPF